MQSKRLLIIGAHPDDEVLGVGGTIAKYCEEGNEVYVYIASEGIATRHEGITEEVIKSDVRKANTILGVKDVFFGGFGYDGRLLDELPNRAIVSSLKNVVNEVQPDLLFTHYINDVNVEHRCLAYSSYYVCNVLAQTSIKAVYSYEVPSSTELLYSGTVFKPNSYINIENYLEKKERALAVYSYEVKAEPHPRSCGSIRATAHKRGYEIGQGASEAFMLVQQII